MNSVNSPSHYRADSGIECIDVIVAWGLGFCGGNVLKYLCRVGLKGNDGEDLAKALWYARRGLSDKEVGGHYLGRFGTGPDPVTVCEAWGLKGSIASAVVALNFATNQRGWEALVGRLADATGATA